MIVMMLQPLRRFGGVPRKVPGAGLGAEYVAAEEEVQALVAGQHAGVRDEGRRALTTAGRDHAVVGGGLGHVGGRGRGQEEEGRSGNRSYFDDGPRGAPTHSPSAARSWLP